MRRHRPLILAITLVVTACTAAPSSSPIEQGSAAGTPSRSPAADPTAAATPFIPSTGTWIGFDRRVGDVVQSLTSIYVAEWNPGELPSAIHRLNANGEESPGWPVNLEGALSLMVDGTSLMASACPTGPNSAPCQLHRFREDGTEADGFPIEVGIACNDMRVAWDLAIVLACGQDDFIQLVAVDRTGRTLRGWPQEVPLFHEFGVAASGQLYVVRGVLDREAIRIDVLERNAAQAPGWPVELPTPGNILGIGGVRPHPSGLLMAWWLEDVVPGICLDAKRTGMTVLAADGIELPRWPVEAPGVGSEPAVATTGWSWMRMGGATEAIAGYDDRGRVKDGWPVEVEADPCLPGGPAAVELTNDGRIALVQGSSISLWVADGTAFDGWPVTSDGQFATGCQPAACIPSTNQAIGPVVGHRDRSMYLVDYIGLQPAAMQARVVAFDPDGQPLAGFPMPIPQLPCYPEECPLGAPQVMDVQMTVDERLIVIANEGLFVVVP